MLPIIEGLLILQDRDRRLLRLKAELEAIPGQRQVLEGKAVRTQATFDEVKTRFALVEAERKRLELEVVTMQQRINKLQVEQQATRSNDQYKAFEHQIGTINAEIFQLDERQLTLMEEAEAVARTVQEASKVAAAQKKETDQQLGDLVARESNLQKELAKVQAERTAQAESLDPSGVGKYERILKTRGDNVLVGVHRMVCGGCHVKLPMQSFLQAKAQVDLVYCPNCGRLLYYTREMEG